MEMKKKDDVATSADIRATTERKSLLDSFSNFQKHQQAAISELRGKVGLSSQVAGSWRLGRDPVPGVSQITRPSSFTSLRQPPGDDYNAATLRPGTLRQHLYACSDPEDEEEEPMPRDMTTPPPAENMDVDITGRSQPSNLPAPVSQQVEEVPSDSTAVPSADIDIEAMAVQTSALEALALADKGEVPTSDPPGPEPSPLPPATGPSTTSVPPVANVPVQTSWNPPGPSVTNPPPPPSTSLPLAPSSSGSAEPSGTLPTSATIVNEIDDLITEEENIAPMHGPSAWNALPLPVIPEESESQVTQPDDVSNAMVVDPTPFRPVISAPAPPTLKRKAISTDPVRSSKRIRGQSLGPT